MTEIRVSLRQNNQDIGVGIERTEQVINADINTAGLAEVVHDDTLKGTGSTRNPLGIADDVKNLIENSIQEIECVGNLEATRVDNKVIISEKTFVYEMAIAQTEWVIEHNLNKRPSVVVVDSGGNVITPAISYIDDNTIKVEFNAAFKGVAYLN